MTWVLGALLIACLAALFVWGLCKASANREKAWDEVVG